MKNDKNKFNLKKYIEEKMPISQINNTSKYGDFALPKFLPEVFNIKNKYDIIKKNSFRGKYNENLNSSIINFKNQINRKTFINTNKNNFNIENHKKKEYLIKDMVRIVQININSIKMIHSLSLKIFIVKLYECSDKRLFYDFLKNWKNMKSNNNNFMNIEGVDIGWKKDSLSVIYEYCPLGSLKDLMQNVEFINENAVIELVLNLIKHIKLFQNKFKREFGDIRTTQILFNTNANFILNFGSSNLILNNSKNNFLSDIFRIGILGLSITLGFFINSILDLYIKIYENKLFFEITNKNYFTMLNLNYYFNINQENIMFKPNDELINEYCCFLHFILNKKRPLTRDNYFDNILKNNNSHYNNIKYLRKCLKEFIKKNFEKKYLKFFCFLTRFDKDERFNIEQSSNHSFLNKNINSISLYNFVILSNNPSRNSDKIDNYTERIFEEVKKKYKNSKLWYSLNSSLYLTNGINFNKVNNIIDIDSQEINDLSYELGITKNILWDYIMKLNNF